MLKQLIAKILRRIARELDPPAPLLPPSEEQLRENVVSVCYEVAAMERAALVLRGGGRFRFEAFLIHSRLLREFLWGTGNGIGAAAANSLLGEHYFDDVADWRKIRGGLRPALRRTKDRIDRQIAHLARDRISNFRDLEAEIASIHDEIQDQWRLFEQRLPARWQLPFYQHLREQRELLATNDC
jgi:hypothetical protein